MKRIKGTNYGSKYLSEDTIKGIEEVNHFDHIATEVIKDRYLFGSSVINVSGFFGNVIEGFIYVPFPHPNKHKYKYSVCEIFTRVKGE